MPESNCDDQQRQHLLKGEFMKWILAALAISGTLNAATIIQFKPDVREVPNSILNHLKDSPYIVKKYWDSPRFTVQRLADTYWDLIKKSPNVAIRIEPSSFLTQLKSIPQIEKIIEDGPIGFDQKGIHLNQAPQPNPPNLPCENSIYWGMDHSTFNQKLDDAKPCDGFWIEAMPKVKYTFKIDNGKTLDIYEDGVSIGQTTDTIVVTFSPDSNQRFAVVSGSPGDYQISWRNEVQSRFAKKVRLPEFSNAFGFGSLESTQAFEILSNQTSEKGPKPKHTGAKMMNAGALWAAGYKGQNVRVAVIDTGVDFNHPFLKSALENGKNIVQPKKMPIDDESHGTHVAGIIHQVAPLAKIVPVKVLGEDGSGSVEDVIAGIEWAIEQKVNVINLSLGGDIDQPRLFEVFKKAESQGILVSMASGNDGQTQPTFPARYISKLNSLGFAVGAMNNKWEFSSFSDKSGVNKNMKYVAAHGVMVNSSVPGGGYKKFSGTSMAAPQVAGLIALFKSIPDLNDPKKILEALSRSVYKLKIETSFF